MVHKLVPTSFLTTEYLQDKFPKKDLLVQRVYALVAFVIFIDFPFLTVVPVYTPPAVYASIWFLLPRQ